MYHKHAFYESFFSPYLEFWLQQLVQKYTFFFVQPILSGNETEIHMLSVHILSVAINTLGRWQASQHCFVFSEFPRLNVSVSADTAQVDVQKHNLNFEAS